MFKTLWKKKAIVAFLVILVVTLPVAIKKPAQMLGKTLFTTVGIDMVEGKYQVTGEVIVNMFNEFGAKFLEVVQDESDSINQALNKISKTRGRTVSLAHCSLIVLGSGLQEENIASVLTFLLHRTEVNNNSQLLFTDADMQELFTISKESADNRTNHLQQIATFNIKNQFGTQATLQNFYRDYLSKSKTSTIPVVTIQDEQIHNAGELAVFVSGKYKITIDDKQSSSLKFLENRMTRHQVTIPNTATVEIQSNRSRIRTRIIDGIPTIKIKVSTRIRIVDIDGTDYLDMKSTDVPADEIALSFSSMLDNNLKETLTELSKNDMDILQISDRFWQFHRTDNINLSDVVFEIDCNARVVN